MRRHVRFWLSTSLCFLSSVLIADLSNQDSVSILDVSADPGAVNITTGTGDLGRLFKLGKDSPLRIGGLLTSDGDCILSGGTKQGALSGNNLLILSLLFDTEKASFWKNGLFGAEFLQFNGMDSNGRAGSVQGFDGLCTQSPWNRSELYQLWFRQTFFDSKLAVRIGKMAATIDFNNVLRPTLITSKAPSAPSLSGLLFTPIFLNPVNLGVMPGYLDTAYGVMARATPIKDFYISAGFYDGNQARGKRTGLEGPHFNGYYFTIAETGVSWDFGPSHKPGIMAIGAWNQTGDLSIPEIVQQKGAQGVYLFGSQRVWFRNPGQDYSGVSMYWQAGHNNAPTLPMNDYFGLGFSAYALTRPRDSFGVGMAFSKINKRLGTRPDELMFQGYYQTHLFFNTYLQPVVSYIPTPAGGVQLPQTWVATLQMISLF